MQVSKLKMFSLFNCILIAFVSLTCFIYLTSSLECYVCKDQEDNKDKCVETVKTCDLTEDRCMSMVRWGSTPYWAPSGTKQFYISKWCSSKQNCDKVKANLTGKCDRISYNDWQCVDCCHGDRCNYFVTLASSSVVPNQLLILISIFASLITAHKLKYERLKFS